MDYRAYLELSHGTSDLAHVGTLGMRWGVRKAARYEKKLAKRTTEAEKIIGRKVKPNDFGGMPTKRGAKMVKEYDDLKKRYNKIKKPGDNNFDWMMGAEVSSGVSVGRRGMKRILKKLEKNPAKDANKLYKSEFTRASINMCLKRVGISTALVTGGIALSNAQIRIG